MKRLDNILNLPEDIDYQCIELCNFLNSIPGVQTFESCCGHCRERFSIWFHCDSIPALTRLGRATERNYSDGKWEIVVDSTDNHPYGVFWLRSKEPFTSYLEMEESAENLAYNFWYWFKDVFDDYFEKKPYKKYEEES